jgi:hypothetical protein
MGKLWIVGIIIAIIATLGGGAWYVAVAASSLYVSVVAIESIDEVTGEGISFSGDIEVTNPSGMGITLEELRYRIIVEKTREEIARGVIGGDRIPAGGSVRLPLRQQTSWKPSMETLLSLASDKEVYLTIDGDADVVALGVPLTGPFRERMDIKPLVDSWIRQKKAELMKDPQKFLKQHGIMP